METFAVFGCALAVSAFCVLHTVKIIMEDRKERRRQDEIEKVRKELEDEIMHEGNASRIRTLKCRLHDLRNG